MQFQSTLSFRADAQKPATTRGGVLRRILMAKDGREVFVMNLRAGSKRQLPYPDSLRKLQAATAQLAQTEGRFFRLMGEFADPFSLLEQMETKDLHFIHPDNITGLQVLQLNGLTDDFAPVFEVSGNLIERSSAFRYRFYCAHTFNAWKERAQRLIAARTN